MHLVYLDEVKHDGNKEPYHWLCGLAVPQEDIVDIETSLNTISKDFFGSPLLDVSTEFHATHIIQGKGAFKGRAIDERLSVIQKLAKVISDHPNIGRIVVRVDVAGIAPRDCQKLAFMLFVERVNQLMRARSSLGLLIADLDKEYVSANVRNLSSYKAMGTEFRYGQEIKHVVDTVHHTQSHHSRLLQLADLYAYSIALSSKTGLKNIREAYCGYIKELDNFRFPTKYKYWPSGIYRA